MSTVPGRTILAVASGGGHWVQLRRLQPAFNGHRVVYVTVSEIYRQEVGEDVLYTVRDVTRWNKLGWCLTMGKLLFIIMRERPDVVISTGALPGYFAIRLARLFGARCIWLDSIANAEELSLSGEKIGRHVDLWLTQWQELSRDGGPRYEGKVL